MKNLFRNLARIVTVSALLALMSVPKAHSAPAYPYPISYTQPDGSVITLSVHGDERFGYTTSGNIPVVKSADGYYYYASYGYDQINVTDIRVGSPQTRGALPSAMTSDVIAHRRANSPLNSPFADGGTYMRAIQINSSLAKSVEQRAAASTVIDRPLVILVEYKDVKFTTSSAKIVFDDKLNGNTQAPLGSARTYFSDNSSGVYNPSFQIYGVVALKNNSSYYAGDDGTANAWEMVVEACEALNASVNFKNFDQNNDGVLDNVALIFAGHNQAEGAGTTTVWPHRWDVRNVKAVTVDGVVIGGYSVSSEFRGAQGASISSIGTFVHEFSHVLGLTDVYDTNYDIGGDAEDIGSFSLMGSGNYNNGGDTPPYLNAFERNQLGWLNFDALPMGTTQSLEPIGSSNKAYRIESGSADEFFVVEARESTGWDTYLSTAAAQDMGLAIYHVDLNDQTVITTVDGSFTALQLWARNTPNAYAIHPCFKLLRSAGYVNNGLASSYLFPGNTNNTYISGNSSPAMVSWSGQKVDFEISEIAAGVAGVNFTVGVPVERYAVSGAVVSSVDNAALANVSIKLSPVVQPPVGGAPLRVIDFSETLTRASGELIATTNGNGIFSFENVDAGDYTLTAYLYGFVPYSQEITITGDTALPTITLESESQSLLETRISHSDVITTGFLTGRTEGLAVNFTPSDLADKAVQGLQIQHLYILSGVENAEMTAKIFHDANLVYSTGFVSKLGYNYVPVNNPVLVPSDADLRIEFTFPEISGSIVALDQGPAAVGGDLVKTGGAWASLKNNYGIDVNIAVGFSVPKTGSEIASPEIRMSSLGQRYFSFVWDSSDLGVDSWNVEVVGDDGSRISETVSERGLTVSAATPGTNYTLSVTPVVNGVAGDAKTMEFSTPAISAPFSAMKVVDLGDGRYMLSYNNTQEPPVRVQIIDMQLDGSGPIDITYTHEYVPILLEGPNSFTLVIEYADGTSETITRTIEI